MTTVFQLACGFALVCLAFALLFCAWHLLAGPTPQDRVLALDTLYINANLLAGPTPQDRVLALDTLYINAMLILIVLGVLFQQSIYYDIALLISVTGFVSSAAMAKFLLRGEVIQ